MQEDDLINIAAQTANIVEKLEQKAKQNIEFSEEAVNKLIQNANSIHSVIEETLDNHAGQIGDEVVDVFKK